MENVTSDPLLVALTFDAEADAFDSSIDPTVSRPLGWRGIEEGIPLIDDVLCSCTDFEKGRARVTWYVRCDSQIATFFGDAAHLLDKYRECWRNCIAAGDEIGFHPHLYRLADHQWQQETDGDELRAQINSALLASRHIGFAPVSSRIGEAFSSNAVMAALDECGFHCDSSAMPGRVRHDHTRHLDWKGTPTAPFQPSIYDYRTPGLPARRLLEVPMSMIDTRADYDQSPLLRYVDLSFHHASIRTGLSEYLRTARLLVTVTHPSSVLPDISSSRHGLLSFHIREFRRNLEFILSECDRLGRDISFITISECSEIFAPTTVKI